MSKQKSGTNPREASGAGPRAAKHPHRLQKHGDTRIDDYYWLRNRKSPAVIDHLNAENRYTKEILEPYESLRAQLLKELKTRIPQDDSSAPYREGDFFYYHRYEKDREYPVYCRRRGSMDADEQVMLDVNVAAGDQTFYSVRNFAVSPDHRKAAFAVDTEGRRFFTLRFLDLETGEFLADTIADVSSDYEWANDSRTVLYARQDRETLRHYQVLRHRLGDSEDSLVFQENDATFWVGVERSLSGKFLFIVSAATLSTEVHYLPADRPKQAPALFLRREPNHEYYVSDGLDRFFILSNDQGARNFKILQTPLGDTSKASWKEFIAHRKEVFIDSMEIFRSQLVLSTVTRGSDRIEIVSREGGRPTLIEFDEPAHTVYPDDNYEYDAAALRFSYESMTTPPSVFDFNFATHKRSLVKEQAVHGGFDKRNYRSERHWVTARDGTEVPVSLVYRDRLLKNGSRPLLLYAYGAYGISTEPDFDSDVLSLLDRGFVYAIAHVRGGTELGRRWYEDGRQNRKHNTFNDFIDVTRYLIDEGFTSAERCYASGGSAGGLLIGAVANLAPDLYNGVATRVPFVDVVTTMLDESIPLTTGEFDEWGNPAVRADYDYMLSYSPYDNVSGQDYPHMLVTTGLHDSQVQYWEPAKWVAKLRAEKTDNNLLLFQVDMQAGHSGRSGRFRSLEDEALVYAFFLLLEERAN